MWSFEFFSKLRRAGSHITHSSASPTPAVTRQLRFYSSSTANGAEMFCQVGAVFEEFGLVLGFPMYLLVGLAESRCCCSALELQQSSNNCHSHSGFSRMSRQKAWRTCQRPQGFDSCMHKTLARFRSQQDTALAAGISLVVESQIGTSTSTRTKPRETVYCWCCREIGWILFPKINWQ